MDITRYLFLEVANGVLISISEEVEDFMLYVIFLQVIHQMGPITLQEKKKSKLTNRVA